MTPAPLPPDEDQRLARLRALEVLDSPPEAEFDALVQAAALVCGVPVSLVSLVDADRQWFKANVGLPGVSETPREVAFCAHAILQDGLFEVPDASLDPRFADNPLVAGQPDIRFYAGAPLRLASGHAAGTLCVIDRQPRQLSESQRQVLEHLALAASRLLERRQQARAFVAQQRALEQALERVELATEGGRVGVWEYDPGHGGVIWNATMQRLYGRPDGEPPPGPSDWLAWVHPEDRAATAERVREMRRTPGAHSFEFRVVTPAGEVRHLHSAARAAPGPDGRSGRILGVNWDVTALRRLAAELSEKHELLRVTLESIGDAVITTDREGRIVWLNPVAERMTGWTAAESAGRPLAQVFHIVHEETREPAPSPVQACLADEATKGLATQTLLIARDGREYGIEDSAAPIRDAKGRILGAVLVFHDVTEQRRLSGEMNYRATHDMLTGLVNRSEFELRLRRTLASAHESGGEHSLLYIDLDQFKLVNDACGHSVGDLLLQQVSRLLGDAVRSRDTLARLGGDEFGVILEHCTPAQAQRVAQLICERMDDFRFVHEGRRFRIGASIGLVPVDARWIAPAAVLQAADAACYAAKEAGRNRVHTWFDTDAAMRARAGDMRWATRLEQALDEGRFELHAQRIVPLAPGEHGLHAEVLLRLREPDGSLVPPGVFLPAAERFQLSSRIDRWVLREAIQWVRHQPEARMPDLLAVNLSGQSIGDRAFHRQAIELLAAAGDAVCRSLCLEITETVAITNLADAALFIEQVRALGVRIALDDFGAGASSFGYLKQLRVDLIKIDGQFIKDLLDDPLDDAAVRCFVDVARVVGVQTVAEFVDRPEVLARVRELGIDHAQGFLLHRPAPIDALRSAPAADRA